MKEWNEIRKEWQQDIDFQLPRRNTALMGKNLELHAFTDASQIVYATVIYARSNVKGEWVVELVFAKNRLNPCKEISIPRLELLAILIGVRALNE